jgi:hypothetical protein
MADRAVNELLAWPCFIYNGLSASCLGRLNTDAKSEGVFHDSQDDPDDTAGI